ncbi:MAG: MFS transporter [Acidimicrobiia bacterium]|nr:MFS transporter [Acidimicrobiia bacterium]
MADAPSCRRAQLAQRSNYPSLVLGVALLGLIASNFMVSVLAAVVGELADEFGTSTSTMVWVVLGPNLGFAVLAVTAGKLADLYGRRPAFLVALWGSMLFGGLSAAAWSPGSLIAFRTISAIFGSACGPAGIAIVTALYPQGKRIKVLGLWSMVMAGGPVLGILIGGPVIELASWRWIFVAQVPITLVAIVAAHLVLPDTPRAADVRFDLAGTLLLASAATGFLFAVNRGPVWGWLNPALLTLYVAVPVLVVAFVLQERRAPVPLIPVSYFGRRNFALPLVSMFFTQFSYMGAGFVLAPLFLSEVLDYSPTRASYLVTSRPLFFGIAGPVVGALGARLGERTLSVAGTMLVVASSIGLAMVDTGTSDLFIFATLGIAGFGLGLVMPAMIATITNAVDPGDVALAGGAQQMVVQLGTVAGIQILQSLQVAREAAVGPDDSFTQAFVIGAMVSFIGVAGALFVRRSAPVPPSAAPAAPAAGPRPVPTERR